MKLYTHPFSPPARAVLLTASHAGVPLEINEVNAASGEQKSPEFLRLNPNGLFPVLVDGDFALWESVAIMQYLAEKSGSALWPRRAQKRADVTRWQCWAIAHWAPLLRPFIFENAAKPYFMGQAPDDDAVAQAVEPFHNAATILDRQLDGRTWLLGGDLTLADFSVAAVLMHRDAAKIPLGGHANVESWFGRITDLPAWQETQPLPFARAA